MNLFVYLLKNKTHVVCVRVCVGWLDHCLLMWVHVPKCGTRNHNNDEKCFRCDPPPRGGRAADRNEFGNFNTDEADDVDEFGRGAATQERANKKKTPGIKWPPAFTRRSGAYVFDARSSMFYHASSDFFYDPKTKFYYGNKQKLYYQHCPGQNPPFQEYQAQAANNKEEKKEDEKKPAISIKLKTTKLASCEKKQITTEKQQLSKTKKSTDDNLNRWVERNREKRGEEMKIFVTKTTSQPVCLLCKRKFKDLDHLYRHESKSEMHKNNLQKHLAKKRHSCQEARFYRDRTLERRILHGPEEQYHIQAATTDETTMVPNKPEDNLGESNIGNKMLQNLGWKSGDGQGGALKKDWERIEALASKGK